MNDLSGGLQTILLFRIQTSETQNGPRPVPPWKSRLSDQEKADYKAKNKKAIDEHFVPAYERLITGHPNRMSHQGGGNFRSG